MTYPLALPDTCTRQEPCLHWFTGMGFRPAVWAIHRDQYGDRPILIVGDDGALDGKYDGFSEDLVATLSFGGGMSAGSGASGLWEPVRPETPIVPLPASAWALIAALALLMSIRRRRA